MSTYDLDKLMSETRRLAVEYRRTTGSTLPVSADLANYDAIKLLQMEKPQQAISGVDAIYNGLKILIKGRVIFSAAKKGVRIGQLNVNGEWDAVVVVVFNQEYQPQTLYQASRQALQQSLQQGSKNARGALTLDRFKALSEIVWQK